MISTRCTTLYPTLAQHPNWRAIHRAVKGRVMVGNTIDDPKACRLQQPHSSLDGLGGASVSRVSRYDDWLTGLHHIVLRLQHWIDGRRSSGPTNRAALPRNVFTACSRSFPVWAAASDSLQYYYRICWSINAALAAAPVPFAAYETPTSPSGVSARPGV